jgi:hypothetical protein
MAEYKQIEHAVKKWEEKQQMVADKLVPVEELQRKNNILIFGVGGLMRNAVKINEC